MLAIAASNYAEVAEIYQQGTRTMLDMIKKKFATVPELESMHNCVEVQLNQVGSAIGRIIQANGARDRRVRTLVEGLVEVVLGGVESVLTKNGVPTELVEAITQLLNARLIVLNCNLMDELEK